MNLDLAKYHIADLMREAEQDRLARQLRQADSPVIDAVGLRERIGRLLGGFPALRANGPKPAGA
jgi:hypothetical protein